MKYMIRRSEVLVLKKNLKPLTTNLFVTFAESRPKAKRYKHGWLANIMDGDFCCITVANTITMVIGSPGNTMLVPWGAISHIRYQHKSKNSNELDQIV